MNREKARATNQSHSYSYFQVVWRSPHGVPLRSEGHYSLWEGTRVGKAKIVFKQRHSPFLNSPTLQDDERATVPFPLLDEAPTGTWMDQLGPWIAMRRGPCIRRSIDGSDPVSACPVQVGLSKTARSARVAWGSLPRLFDLSSPRPDGIPPRTPGPTLTYSSLGT